MKAWAIRRLLWPAMEMRGNRIREYLAEMQATAGRSADEVRALQRDRLRELLRFAVTNVPAYRPYADRVGALLDADPEQALRALPVLTKRAFNDRRDDYFADGVDRTKLIANRTGGSTGEPTTFYMDRITVEHYEAARWRGLGWHGIRIGDPSVMIWGSTIELNQMQSRKYWLKERLLKNRIMIPAYALKAENVEQYLRQIRAFRPHYLYGYASALQLLADLMLERGLKPGVALKAVVSTSETLHPHQRESIEAAFGCKAVNEYGARDGGILAYECPHGGMHIAADNAWLEVVDLETLEPVPVGQRGLLLVTDLHNRVMPRLRYQLGDVAALSPDTCTCGMGLPLLAAIEGREDDTFVAQDGTFIHGHYFNHLMRNLTGFRTFQIIQHSRDRVTVKLVKHESRYRPEEERTFLDGIRRALGNGVEIRTEYVDDIPRGPSGKLRYAIREFSLRGE
jgi:phenylacetate-CoA ligase